MGPRHKAPAGQSAALHADQKRAAAPPTQPRCARRAAPRVNGLGSAWLSSADANAAPSTALTGARSASSSPGSGRARASCRTAARWRRPPPTSPGGSSAWGGCTPAAAAAQSASSARRAAHTHAARGGPPRRPQLSQERASRPCQGTAAGQASRERTAARCACLAQLHALVVEGGVLAAELAQEGRRGVQPNRACDDGARWVWRDRGLSGCCFAAAAAAAPYWRRMRPLPALRLSTGPACQPCPPRMRRAPRHHTRGLDPLVYGGLVGRHGHLDHHRHLGRQLALHILHLRAQGRRARRGGPRGARGRGRLPGPGKQVARRLCARQRRPACGMPRARRRGAR